MDKKFFECKVCGDIHQGNNAPNPCPTCGSKDSQNEIKGYTIVKKFSECKVCQDFHWGEKAPNPCPTCMTKDSYVEITKEELPEKLGM